MAKLIWNKEMETGISRIDQQHHDIFMMLDELVGLLEKEVKDPAVIEIVRTMSKHTIEHFFSEEIYMSKHAYPEYEKHKALHSALVKQLMEFTSKMVDGRFQNPEEIIEFMKRNVLDHIYEEDLALGEYLRSKGVS